MSIRCGFFNSVNEDRLYPAEDMNQPYNLLVSNGVFATQEGTPSDYLQVYAESGLTVRVKTGRGIFGDKWFLSDTDILLTIEAANVTLPRIDSVIVQVDRSEEVRAASIYIKKGTASETPVHPQITRSDEIMEYRLADIYVESRTTAISQADITDTRGLSDCGWVTGLLTQLDTSTLYEQWQAGFDAWFRNVKETLSTATLIRSYTSSYTTSSNGETEIPIQIVQYNQNIDILQVFVNGLRLIPTIDYTIDSNEQITLEKDLMAGQQVSFIVYKSIDGSDAETVVSQVVDLQNLVNRTMVTDPTGTTKLRANSGEDVLAKFVAAGRGFHTMYSQNGALNVPPTAGAYRYFGHLTTQSAGSEVGWLFGIAINGNVYGNYLDAGRWRGWKEITNSTQITADNGGAQIEVTDGTSVLTAFENAGTGFHTMYSASGAADTPITGAFRYFGHITGATTGYIFAMSSAGAVFSNYRNGGEWLGWKVLYEKNPATLWEGAYFMNENQTVTPSKPLDQCQHGWVLVWSDYDDATSTKNNYNAVTFCVPKKNASGGNWNGSSFMCCLPREVKTDGTFVITAKQVYIYNDKITGFAANNANPANRDVILSAVYEY
ncbi:MAG: hypothetical protein MJY71_08260 [Bacteroidaceae bacterium]|nr:hypothetical protein [Bacteroidaceae bacterium]